MELLSLTLTWFVFTDLSQLFVLVLIEALVLVLAEDLQGLHSV